jgi:YesN/AraC family two-component response regulator
VWRKHIFQLMLSSQKDNLDDFSQKLFRFISFTDSTKTDKNRKIVNELHIKYETDQKVAAIAENAKRLKTTQRHLILAVSGIIILALSVLLIMILYYRLKRGYRDLYRRNQELLAAKKAQQRYRLETYVHGENEDPDEKLWQNIYQKLSNEKLFLEKDLSLVRLAEACETNKTYISKLINSRSGINFNQFVNNFRVEYAMNLLADEDISLDNIARDSGFNSVSSFFRIFRQSTGLTPAYYRKTAQIIRKAEFDEKDSEIYAENADLI